MNYSWSRICVALLNDEEPSEDDVNYVCGVRRSKQAPMPSTTLPKSLQDAIDDGSITTMNVMDILDRYRDSVPGFHDLLQSALKEAGYVCRGFSIVALKEAL